jgi:formylglycine-generating enzyme required for sulfatase activity
LPTEAEWEYACRAGTSTLYYTGDERSDLNRAGWWSGNSGLILMPISLKEPNSWGLYDILGNVFEWCNDWYDPYYYQISPRENPTGPQTGGKKVIRGGGYCTTDIGSSCFFRTGYLLTMRQSWLGFRIVRSAQ